MQYFLVQSPVGLLALFTFIATVFFWLAQKTGSKVFKYFPPLLFIYFIPNVLSNTGLIPHDSILYDEFISNVLPFIIVIVLINVDVKSAFHIMGRGIFVMLFGTLGVIVGAPISFLLVKTLIGSEGWKAFGSIAGGWIGGNANLVAVSQMIDTPGAEFGLAIVSDNIVFFLWLPLLLATKNWSKWFHRFTGASREHIESLERSAQKLDKKASPIDMRQIMYLLCIGLTATLIADKLSEWMPTVEPVLSSTTWKIAWVTTFGLVLSFTPAQNIPGSHSIAVALLYVLIATMGAKARIVEFIQQAPWFIMACIVWVFIHGFFCLLGAKLFKMDIHTASIASCANIGGVASVTIVAGHHSQALVPVSILMALIGDAIGNYGGWINWPT